MEDKKRQISASVSETVVKEITALALKENRSFSKMVEILLKKSVNKK